jgi:hypothetical protein
MYTFAVVTRIFKGEKPYINNFLDYYVNYLKVDMVYLFSNDETNWNTIIHNSFKTHIKIDYCPAEFDEKKNIARNMNLLDYMSTLYLECIKEDYIINVDCDEYLYINNKSLNDFVSEYNYDNIYINWVFFSSNNFSDLNPIDIISNTKGIENAVGKSLSKRTSMIKIYDTGNKTMHKPLLKEDTTSIQLKSITCDYYIIHITSRNFRDTIIQEYFWNGEKNINNFIENKLTNENFNIYPSRFKINKIFLDFNKNFNEKQYNPIFEGFNFNFHFVKMFEIEILKELYTSFKENNEENVIYNMSLDFSNNSKYMENLKLLEVKPKNYYKKTNFNK